MNKGRKNSGEKRIRTGNEMGVRGIGSALRRLLALRGFIAQRPVD